MQLEKLAVSLSGIWLQLTLTRAEVNRRVRAIDFNQIPLQRFNNQRLVDLKGENLESAT